MEVNKPVATTIIVVINLILIFLFVVPKYQEVSALNEKLSERQAELSSESAYYATLEKLILKIGDREDELGKIQNALPESFSLAPVMNFLQKKGAESGLVVKSITFSQLGAGVLIPQSFLQTGGKEIKNVSLSLNLLGSYEGLKNFISALEKSARLFEVDAISFNSAPSQGIAKMKNKFQTYEFKLKLITHTY